MKKFGFTLAEVLITLGIIGVVAALTAPGLILNGQNQANAAKLSVNISNLENAFANAITNEGVSGLDELSWWNAGNTIDAKFVGNLSKYLQTMGYRDQTIVQYYGDSETKYDGSSYLSEDALAKRTKGPFKIDGTAMQPTTYWGDTKPIILKNGAVVSINKKQDIKRSDSESEAIVNNGGSLVHQVALVNIDVNGTDSPNKLGRDIFTFYLSDSGILYPVAGMDAALFEKCEGKTGSDNCRSDAEKLLWSGKDKYWACNSTKMGEGSGCTARLIEENYKMNY